MIKSVQKATSILTLLSNNSASPVTISEISTTLNINKATCCHLIETLENDGFITKISRSKGYILGPASYCLSRFENYNNRLIDEMKPIINYLHKNLKHTVILAIIEAEQKYIIDYIDDENYYEKKPKILSDDIYRTATGRAILANSANEEIYKIFQKLGLPSPYEWEEIHSVNDLYAYAKNSTEDRIHKTKHKRSDGYHLGYAIALFNNKGCVGAIGLGIREEKISKEEDKIRYFLTQGAKIANNRLKSKSTL